MLVRSAALLLTLGSALPAAPFVYLRGVVNAASFAPPGLANGGIARGSIFSVFGRELGPQQGVRALSFPLQTALAGVSLEVCQSGTCISALLLFVSAGQINAVMPSAAPLGPSSLRVTYSGQAGNFTPVEISQSSVGVFAVNGGGFGPGVVQNFLAGPDQPVLNSAVAAASRGQVVVLWATGLGPGLNPDNLEAQSGDLPVELEIWVGGKRVTNKLYAGRSSCCSGLDQIVFTVPDDAPLGCYVPVQLRTGASVLSNSVSIAVGADGSSCSDPLNPLADLRQVESMGVVLAGRFETGLDFFPGVEVRFGVDTAAASFQRRSPSPWLFNRVLSLPPVGTCTVYQFRGKALDQKSGPALLAATPTLNAGAALSITSGGESYASLPLPPDSLLYLGQSSVHVRVTALDTDIFGGGSDVGASLPGGSDVGAASFTIRTPPSIEWLNRAELATVDRSRDLTLRWTTSGAAMVLIAGSSTDAARDASAAFLCSAPAEDGTFAVPQHILSSMPATPANGPTATTSMLGMAAFSASAERFEARGLDLGLALFAGATAREIRLR